MDAEFELDEHGGPTLRRPAGMPSGKRGERLLLSALAHEMIERRGAQEMVRELLEELERTELRAERAERRLHLIDLYSAPTPQEANEAWLADRFFEVGHTAYAFWTAGETPEALHKAVGDCVRRMDAPEAER